MPTIQTQIVATGGSIMITVTPSTGASSGNVTISRSVGALSNPQTIIYNGPYGGGSDNESIVCIDDGEALPSYLDTSQTYFYHVTDSGGTATTSGIQPLAQLTVIPNWFDKLLFRLFKAGIDSLTVPNNFKKADVLQAMPLTWGSEKLPMVTMNLDLQQQRYVGIGRDVYSAETNTQVKSMIVARTYSITTLSQSAAERDYYKDACYGIAMSIMPTLASIGQNMEYSIQAAQSQASAREMMPGFYVADINFDITGMFNVTVTTAYGVINTITPIVSGGIVSGMTTTVSF